MIQMYSLLLTPEKESNNQRDHPIATARDSVEAFPELS